MACSMTHSKHDPERNGEKCVRFREAPHQMNEVGGKGPPGLHITHTAIIDIDQCHVIPENVTNNHYI